MSLSTEIRQAQQLQQLGIDRSDRITMQHYFSAAQAFPKHLVTQNNAVMQKAYTMVPANVWQEKLIDLQSALLMVRGNEFQRRNLVTQFASGMSAQTDDLLNRAFLDKYDELMVHVVHNFRDFFPYHIARAGHKLMVLEKMPGPALIEYVLQRL